MTRKKPTRPQAAASAEPGPEDELTAYRLVVLAEQDGSSHFEMWLSELRDRAARARVLSRLARIELSGNFGDHRERISGPVSELRIDYGPGYRLYYVRHGDVLVVLLGGGVKSGQQNDIQAAVALWDRSKEDVEGLSRVFRNGFA